MNGDDHTDNNVSGPGGGTGPGAPSGPPRPPGQPPGYGWPTGPAAGLGAPPQVWPVPAPRRGLLREHPLLVLTLFFLFAAAVVAIIGMAIAGGGEGSSFSGMDGFGKKVGVIKVEGLIVDPTDVVEQIHRFRDDDSITAVVLRVDSPGGTVGASQEISAEVGKLAAEKPVVVSMGTVAASGGYYISCPATVIFANPGTITGSIGVVMEVKNLEGLFDWMKIKNYTIKSGEFKDVGSPYREMTDKERKYLQDFVNKLYHQFERAVADGRKMKLEDVDKIADGRIYSGEEAKKIGLVDEIGDLWDAIDEAGKKGGIEGKPKVVWPPRKRPSFLEAFTRTYLPALGKAGEAASPVRVMYLLDISG